MILMEFPLDMVTLLNTTGWFSLMVVPTERFSVLRLLLLGAGPPDRPAGPAGPCLPEGPGGPRGPWGPFSPGGPMRTVFSDEFDIISVSPYRLIFLAGSY